MKSFFKKITEKLLCQKTGWMIAGVVLLCTVPHLAFAADSASTGGAGDKNDVVQNIAQMLSLLIQFLNTLLWPFLIMMGDLMDVDLILGPGMEERLHSIWVQFRNLVNIAFVLVLLVVAIYNILGLGGGEGELAIKTALPKIVLGLVLVNFTFIAGKVILDLVNVGTTVAFGLPQMADSYSFEPQKDEFEQNVCFRSQSSSSSSSSSGDEVSFGDLYWDKDDPDVPFQTKIFCRVASDAEVAEDAYVTNKYVGLRESLDSQYFSDLNKNNVALIMAVNMGSLGSLNILKVEGVKTFTDLTVNFIFSVVMYLVFAISYVVMGIVLLTRVIVLWMAMALSPLAVFFYVVPQAKEWLGEGGDFSKKVVKHLISPMIFGVTFSLGYLLMDAWNDMAGNASNAYGGVQADQLLSTEFLVSGIDDLPKFIIAIASIVVVWTGVFSAASGTVAEGITGKIKGFGDTVKEALFKAPMLIPTVPLDVMGEPGEALSLGAAGMLFENSLNQVTSGTIAANQLRKISEKDPDNALLNFGLGKSGSSNGIKTPVESAQEVIDIMKGRNGTQLNINEATRLAQNLITTIRSGNLDGKEKTDLVTKVQKIQRDYEGGNRDLASLKELLKEFKEKPQALGLNTSQMNALGEIFSMKNEIQEEPKAVTTTNTTTKISEGDGKDPETQVKKEEESKIDPIASVKDGVGEAAKGQEKSEEIPPDPDKK